MSQVRTNEKWLLTSVELRDACADFMLSRPAMNYAPAALEFYEHTAGKFWEWIEQRGATSPKEVTARQPVDNI
jgi:hypothetical protein